MMARSPALAPFGTRSFRYQWPADLCTAWALEMETIILGWYVLVESGSVVQLTDDRYAMVVGVNSSRPLKPRVAVADTRVPIDEGLILDLEKAPNLGIRRSLRPQALPADIQECLSPRPRVAYFFEPNAEAEPE